MALYSNKRSVISILKFDKTRQIYRNVGLVYKGAQLLWQYVRSCFGRGYWLNEKPWSNTDGWHN